MFWTKLQKPFFALAPMEDVTDTVFRQIIASVARPNVFFTEFTNVDGINAVRAAREFNITNGIYQRLMYSEIERPVVAQIWGLEPKSFFEAAGAVKELGFDGVDINFGCPVREVVRSGACGGMIGENTRAAEIIAATREGAAGLPVSVKTRIGQKKIITEEWASFLLDQGIAALTVHGRTVAEQSLVPAHWDEIGKVVKLRDQMNQNTLIIGNGDVNSIENGQLKIDNYGVDGVMIGRGVFKNPAVFDSISREMSREEKIDLLKKHLELWQVTWGERKHFALMKKYVKMYVNGFDGASELRAKMMECKDLAELLSIL